MGDEDVSRRCPRSSTARTRSSRRPLMGRGSGARRRTPTGAGEVFAIDRRHARPRVRVGGDPPARPQLDPGEVGRLVAAMHRVPIHGAAARRTRGTPIRSARPAWDRAHRGALARGAPFAADMAAMRDDLVGAESLIEPARELRTCHRDLWADNLRPTASGGMCVIDWENCGLADPGQELSGVLFEFWRGEPDRARELYREYRPCGGPGRIDRRGSFSMTSPSSATSPRSRAGRGSTRPSRTRSAAARSAGSPSASMTR